MFFNDNIKNTNIDSNLPDGKEKKDVPVKNNKTLMIIIAIIVVLIIIGLICYFASNKSIIKLYGSEDIVVYQNSPFVDPGYEVTDKSGKKINKVATVSGKVDTKIPGEYIIKYSVGKTVKERRINVVASVGQITIIVLKGGDVIKLNLGEKYVEPGYSVMDSSQRDLEKNVIVKSNLDETKPGTYKITYSITNSSGVTIYKERTIIISENTNK